MDSESAGPAGAIRAQVSACFLSLIVWGCPAAARAQCESVPATAMKVYAITSDSQLDVMDSVEISGNDSPHSFIVIDNVVDAQISVDASVVR